MAVGFKIVDTIASEKHMPTLSMKMEILYFSERSCILVGRYQHLGETRSHSGFKVTCSFETLFRIDL